MSILITQKGHKSVKVNSSPFILEDHLQEYIHQNPEAIPLYDIKDDIHLSVLVREFPSQSGPIDAVGVDKDGEIYLVETKLFRNADKRKVVAQILDYAASLWANYRSGDDFITDLNGQLQRQSQIDLITKLTEFYEIDTPQAQDLITNIKTNLQNGRFKLVVLMDSLHQQLRDLITFINQNSEFDIYAVELEYYQHEDLEITIPKLFGAQVKKDISSVSSKRVLGDDDFTQAYSDVGLGEVVGQIVTLFNQINTGESELKTVSVAKGSKSLNFYLHLNANKITISLHVDPTYDNGSLGIAFNNGFWNQENYNKLKPIFTTKFPGIELNQPSNFNSGKLAKWSLKDVTINQLKELLTNFPD